MDYVARVACANTFPKLLRLNALEYSEDVAFREKDFGVWREFTRADYQTRVHDFALGLVDLDLSGAMSSRASATFAPVGSQVRSPPMRLAR
jgi:long-chain acyl-CoA synthetase